jgi:Mandelate racemase / muconate lactonizing enzyme, N-terminal domain
MITHDLSPFIAGREAGDVEALHDAMQWHVHYVGRGGGVTAFAISAIDIALWDLRGKIRGEPLWKMAGGAGIDDACLLRRDRPEFPAPETTRLGQELSRPRLRRRQDQGLPARPESGHYAYRGGRGFYGDGRCRRLTRQAGPDGNVPTELNLKYSEQRASKGGLLIAEASQVVALVQG